MVNWTIPLSSTKCTTCLIIRSSISDKNQIDHLNYRRLGGHRPMEIKNNIGGLNDERFQKIQSVDHLNGVFSRFPAAKSTLLFLCGTFFLVIFIFITVLLANPWTFLHFKDKIKLEASANLNCSSGSFFHLSRATTLVRSHPTTLTHLDFCKPYHIRINISSMQVLSHLL